MTREIFATWVVRNLANLRRVPISFTLVVFLQKHLPVKTIGAAWILADGEEIDDGNILDTGAVVELVIALYRKYLFTSLSSQPIELSNLFGQM